MNRRQLAALATALALTQAVQAQDIVIGQSVALSGPNADIGRDMRDGALAVFARVNASKELGRTIRLVTLDNTNSRQRAAENTQQLLGTQGAVALFGYNSATTSLDALPQAAQADALFFAPFSGSPSLRSHPNVYTIRASYEDEARKIVEQERSVGADKAVVLYYDDEVGHANYDAVAGVFASLGLARPPGVAVKRGSRLDASTAATLLKDAPHYVLATTQYGTLADLLRATSQSGTPLALAALSFVNPDELSESVGELARGTIVSQVIPSPRASNQVGLPVVRDCAEALKAYSGATLDYTSLESCIAAKALVAAIKHAGPKTLTRASLLHAMPTLGKVDLGGFSVTYGPGSRGGSSWVDLTILSRGNRYVQ